MNPLDHESKFAANPPGLTAHVFGELRQVRALGPQLGNLPALSFDRNGVDEDALAGHGITRWYDPAPPALRAAGRSWSRRYSPDTRPVMVRT